MTRDSSGAARTIQASRSDCSRAESGNCFRSLSAMVLQKSSLQMPRRVFAFLDHSNRAVVILKFCCAGRSTVKTRPNNPSSKVEILSSPMLLLLLLLLQGN